LRAYFLVCAFCDECGWMMRQREPDLVSCENPKCPKRGADFKVTMSIARLAMAKAV
jgi:hypothetical protein